MEKDLSIPAKDGKTIYFRMNGESDRVALIIHGFTGSIKEFIHQEAARTFPGYGIATCRISLYNGKLENGRSIDSVSLDDHVNDVNQLLDWLNERFERVYLIGHSLGGVVAILSSQKAERMVLWDPTAGFDSYEEKNFRWNDCLGKFISGRRIPVVVSKELIEQWREWKAEKLAERIKIPAKFIFARRYNKYELWKDHLGKIPNCRVAFVDSGHVFAEEGAVEKLMEETISWLE